MSLTWVLPEEDLAGCTSAAHDVRRVRARYGARVRARVVAVGGRGDLVRSFLRAERLADLPLVLRSRAAFRRETGAEARPALYVVRDGTIVRRIPVDASTLLARGGAVGLADVIARQLGPPRSSHAAASTSNPHPRRNP